MGNTDNKFDVSVASENKGKDKFTFTFDFKITSENNCRIRIYGCQIYDLDGNMYTANGKSISATDIIIGISKYFNNEKKVNASISSAYKSRIGCSLVLTIADLDEKKKMNVCFQKKSAIRWEQVGIQPLEYEDIIPEEEEVEEVVEKMNQEIRGEEEADKASEELDDNALDAIVEDMAKEFPDDFNGLLAERELSGTAVADETAAAEESPEDMLTARLNKLLEIDENSATRIGITLGQVSLSVEEAPKGGYMLNVYCEPSPVEGRRMLVRCPLIKAFFYNGFGGIDNVAMAHLTPNCLEEEEAVEIELKKATEKYWNGLSKIKIMATV